MTFYLLGAPRRGGSQTALQLRPRKPRVKGGTGNSLPVLRSNKRLARKSSYVPMKRRASAPVVVDFVFSENLLAFGHRQPVAGATQGYPFQITNAIPIPILLAIALLNALQGMDNFIKSWHVRQRMSVALAADLLLRVLSLYYT